MLSRVADNLYWMSRYLERAEHTARSLGVVLNQMLDHDPRAFGPRWERLLLSLRTNPPEGNPHDAYALTDWLTFETDNPASIINSIASARENARQVREQISSEMWEQLNRLYLTVRDEQLETIWESGPQEFLQLVKNGAHLFHGITDGTMSHGEGWRFIQVGRLIERVSTTATLLDVHYRLHLDPPSDPALGVDENDWVALLKSCTAFEAYCKVYTANMRPDCIAEFLLLNAYFPRSVRFAADRIQQGLREIGQQAGSRSAARAERLAGRLSASLDYGQVDEIMVDMHAYLEGIGRQANAIHSAIYQAYISYPVDTALAR